jgi:hypothetical protein
VIDGASAVVEAVDRALDGYTARRHPSSDAGGTHPVATPVQLRRDRRVRCRIAADYRRAMAEPLITPSDALLARRGRPDRHRIGGGAAHEVPAADLELSDAGGLSRTPLRHAPAAAIRPAVHDTTSAAIRRPAQLSDRCAGCGAPTQGRTGMVTELVEVGPVRALRVVACSACPTRHRIALGA